MRLHELSSALLSSADAAQLEVPGSTPAAVLVALFERESLIHAVFTLRRHDLSGHAGEISFPGGRRDPEDETLVATALREAHEEIGLPPDAVEIIGALQPTPTIATGYAVYPFVGLIPPDLRWVPSAGEVSEVMELPLNSVAAGYGRRTVIRRGAELRTDTYLVDHYLIWGATARIVADLLARFTEDSATA